MGDDSEDRSEEESEPGSGGGRLKFLLILLILSAICYGLVNYGFPYLNSHFRRHPVVPTPPPSSSTETSDTDVTPTPLPTRVPTPTPTPSPTPVPTPTPKPTSWAPPAPDQVYPDEWVSVRDDTRYENVKVLYVEADRVTVNCDQGTVIIQISTLPPELQRRLNYDPDLAGKAAAQRDLDRVNDEVRLQKK